MPLLAFGPLPLPVPAVGGFVAALEGRVGELVGRVSDREDAFAKALADVDKASAELAALERDATTFRLGAGVAAAALVAVAALAGQ